MRSDDVRPALQAIAAQIERSLAASSSADGRPLFTLLVWTDDASEGLGAHYVSNAEREDVIRALRETADRLERRVAADSSN